MTKISFSCPFCKYYGFASGEIWKHHFLNEHRDDVSRKQIAEAIGFLIERYENSIEKLI